MCSESRFYLDQRRSTSWTLSAPLSSDSKESHFRFPQGCRSCHRSPSSESTCTFGRVPFPQAVCSRTASQRLSRCRRQGRPQGSAVLVGTCSATHFSSSRSQEWRLAFSQIRLFRQHFLCLSSLTLKRFEKSTASLSPFPEPRLSTLTPSQPALGRKKLA